MDGQGTKSTTWDCGCSQGDFQEAVDNKTIDVSSVHPRGGDCGYDAVGSQGVAIGKGAQGGLGDSCIESRGGPHIYIMAMAIGFTEDIIGKTGITDKVGHERVGVEGIGG